MGETQPHVQVGQAVAQQYFQLFQQNREAVINLYHPQAYLSFEGETKQGHTGIQELLKEKLKFQTIAHQITAVDVQPLTGDNSGIVVFVLGRLKTDEDPPHGFSQTWIVRQVDGNYFIFNDVFRLAIHNSA
ncbi:DgyrCDS8051 [Dimorphilus gyrociliatus]|uniref:NTF2-related export protein n=1 Tax=Dimorphilus gyrociliatus TaxID=2664684 RepID=A0A7I8VT13_9ANNE|nr:DgyrCDS8051 [Dimorphilus gyrociliatus]